MDIDFTHIDQEIPQRMKLVDMLVEKHRAGKPMKDVTALLIQHQLGNHCLQAKALMELGLDPKKLYWYEIPYTSNSIVRERLMDLGIPAQNFFTAADYRLLDFYVPYQRERMHRVLAMFLEHPPEHLLVLDDGAYYLESAICFTRQIPNVSIVEQTARGLIKMESNAALRFAIRNIPVINVAGSLPKKTLEPVFIGAAVCTGLQNHLGARFKGKHRARCLILGYGAIGEQVTRFTEENLGFKADHIYVYDPEIEEGSGKESRYPRWEKEDPGIRFDLVIGCSGRSSFTIGDYVYLQDGAILASASSGSVELSRKEFIELADNSEIDDIWIDREAMDPANVHSDIMIHFPGPKKVTFKNGGFPINFDGRVNAIPARYIQPTVTMMIQAAIQAVTSKETGLLPLDIDFCKWVDGEFRDILGEEAGFLPPSPY